MLGFAIAVANYAGWLRLDDPDGWSASYEVRDRQHGTGMASLITRGERRALASKKRL
jgi:hypothetical protein